MRDRSFQIEDAEASFCPTGRQPNLSRTLRRTPAHNSNYKHTRRKS